MLLLLLKERLIGVEQFVLHVFYPFSHLISLFIHSLEWPITIIVCSFDLHKVYETDSDAQKNEKCNNDVVASRLHCNVSYVAFYWTV